MNPKVTIITATYNSSQTLHCTIESVLAQDFQDFEYLIIGDACSDDSERVVQTFNDSRLRWHNLEVNSGSQAIPNNAGLDLAQGDYVAYIGHDDLWFPWHLSQLIACLEEKELSFVHSMAFLVGPEGLRTVYGVPGVGRTYSNIAAPPSSWLHQRSSHRWRDPATLGIAVDNDFFWRWYQFDQKIDCSRKPSLIKFPSPWWKLYDRRENFPQIKQLERLKENPESALIDLLYEATVLLSTSGTSFLTWYQWLRRGVSPFANRLLTANPEHPWLRAWFQWQRRIVRRSRGLDKP